MRYDVDSAVLREGAGSVEEALARVQRLGVGDELRSLASALPGGSTASGAGLLVAAWQTRFSGTLGELRGLGRSLTTSAEAYDAVEVEVSRALAAPLGSQE